MEHRFYSQANLMVCRDVAGESLFKLFEDAGRTNYQLVDFIPPHQKFIKVFPEHNLIVTGECLFTLDGNKITDGYFDYVQTVSYGSNLLIIAPYTPYLPTKMYKSSQSENAKPMDITTYNQTLLWNGKQIIWHRVPQKIIYSDKYLAVFMLDRWHIYDGNGTLVGNDFQPTDSIEIVNDMIISRGMARHSVYSLTDEKLLLKDQLYVKVSTHETFAVGIAMNGLLTICFRGMTSQMENVEFVDTIDDIGIFYVRYKNSTHYKVFFYSYPLRSVADKVDLISYDAHAKQLILGKNGSLTTHQVKHNVIAGIRQSKIIPLPK